MLTGSERELRVMIVDDQAFARRGFKLMLHRDPGINVIAEASDGLETLEQLSLMSQRNLPTAEVVLMDVRMPHLDGVETTRRVTRVYPAVKVIILTTYDEDAYAFRALAAGASGFLLKDIRTWDLIRAVRAVSAGDAILTPRITRQVIEKGIPHGLSPERRERARVLAGTLTTREYELARLIADGLSNTEIADRMVIEPASVRRYVSRILAKLGLRDRVQVAVEWHKAGLV